MQTDEAKRILRPGSAMLHEFIISNRECIIERARQRVRLRVPSRLADAKLEHGIPLFLSQLVAVLADSDGAGELLSYDNDVATDTDVATRQKIAESSELHGHDMLRSGFSVAQVVHGYGDVCQVVTELASETNSSITSEDFQVFNRCLDDAIAGAVTAYGRQREQDLADEGTERLGTLAHELRNLLGTAIISFDVLKKGTVGLGGSTGAIHSRSLCRLHALVERSLAEVRLDARNPKLERLSLLEFLEEVEVTAALQVEVHGCHLNIVAPIRDAMMVADRQLLSSAVSNLLQNAFKFTRSGGNVELTTQLTDSRVLIEVRDECGGLPPGKAEELFRPFVQAGANRSGLGLGLSIALRAAQANAGDLRVRDIPGKGCVFTIDVPTEPSNAQL